MSGDDDELNRLRNAYEEALDAYAGICANLNKHMLTRTKPSREEIEREAEARNILQLARRRYLEAWREKE